MRQSLAGTLRCFMTEFEDAFHWCFRDIVHKVLSVSAVRGEYSVMVAAIAEGHMAALQIETINKICEIGFMSFHLVKIDSSALWVFLAVILRRLASCVVDGNHETVHSREHFVPKIRSLGVGHADNCQ